MCAGKYSTGATFILGSTTLRQSVMERVSVSHPVEMYSRIGLSPCASCEADCPAAGACAKTAWRAATATNQHNLFCGGRRHIFEKRCRVVFKRKTFRGILFGFPRGPELNP